MASDLYHMPMDYNIENVVLADAAGQALSMVYLKTIREDASAAYSVGAYGSVSRMGDKAFVQIFDQCPMDYNKAELALSLLEGGMKDCDKYIDADKVEKIKANMLRTSTRSSRPMVTGSTSWTSTTRRVWTSTPPIVLPSRASRRPRS